MTQHYIGTKLITAFPQEREGKDGYGVIYADGYTSWSPKDVFEKAYLPMGEGNTNKITQQMVDDFLTDIEIKTLPPKTTVVKATLKNGFIIVESSSCVDASNYDEKLGADICITRIKNKIWELLGFLLQTAQNGVK